MTDIGTEQTVQTLMVALNSNDISVRQQARHALITIGPPAVDQLTTALHDPREQIRWQAALLLGNIGDGRAAVDLINAFQDDMLKVRWRAAESLADLGCQGLAPLLRALIKHPEKPWLRNGAHHALRLLVVKTDLGELIKPVLTALEGIEPTMSVPLASALALQQLNTTENLHQA
ncbi:MAG: HEAT repeat domain-containing protein [Anaerolineae bacterium]|nr:HEAT repeat domain-containing protein [Anaerolineae bacterium]